MTTTIYGRSLAAAAAERNRCRSNSVGTIPAAAVVVADTGGRAGGCVAKRKMTRDRSACDGEKRERERDDDRPSVDLPTPEFVVRACVRTFYAFVP